MSFIILKEEGMVAVARTLFQYNHAVIRLMEKKNLGLTVKCEVELRKKNDSLKEAKLISKNTDS